MAAVLVDVDELRTVLGLGSASLYEPALYQRVADAAEAALVPYLSDDAADYVDVPEVREAALAVAVDLWAHRVAPGGVTQGGDFTPGPWRLGRSLLSRVSGLLGAHLDVGTVVG